LEILKFKCLVGKLFEQQNGVNWEKDKLPLLIKWRCRNEEEALQLGIGGNYTMLTSCASAYK
jgi:hypothetical protein